MRTVFLIIGYFICLTAFAQRKGLALKVQPLALMDEVSFPTIQLGMEFRLGRWISYYQEVGWKYRKGYYEQTDTSFVSSKGYKIKSELRKYFAHFPGSSSNGAILGYYLALNGFYTRDRHNAAITYSYDGDSGTTLSDNFGVEKWVAGGNLVLGKQRRFGGHWLLDWYAGLGGRYRNIDPAHLEYRNGQDELLLPHDLTIDGLRQSVDAKRGHALVPNFTFGIRIGRLL